ncbi:type II toxin-antitoxin system HipA family toxin [Puteibacter caeruleilacunae]|nr:type II toxin-antitoxin system HipA family toxin [Puteibacter caeruleilacunae]
MNNCLICYKPLKHGQIDYHPACVKKMFGTSKAPVLPYSLEEMEKVALKVLERSVTVPGVQAKLSLNLQRKQNQPDRLTLVGLWGNYILKPPTNRYPQLPENESLTMKMAEVFKISTVPNALIRLQSGELAYITRRIDRENKNQKLHMEDMCQLTGRLTEDKYKGSMEQIGKVILKYSSFPKLDALTLFDLALYSFLTGNADMHLKNFSLLYTNEGPITLSPAYDLLSTRLVIPKKDDPEEMALMLNGRKSRFKLQDFIQFSQYLRLNDKQIENSFTRFKRGFSKAILLIENSFLNDELKQQYINLLTTRIERL